MSHARGEYKVLQVAAVGARVRVAAVGARVRVGV